jgi:chloramphenicol 3-O-phosphotransferase
LTEAQVERARRRLGNASMFVILRVRESDRAAREKARREREGRQLTYEFQREWHQIPGPDEIYNVVIDSSSTSPHEAAQSVLDAAKGRWEDLTF